jgi:hypothetical protein
MRRVAFVVGTPKWAVRSGWDLVGAMADLEDAVSDATREFEYPLSVVVSVAPGVDSEGTTSAPIFFAAVLLEEPEAAA